MRRCGTWIGAAAAAATPLLLFDAGGVRLSLARLSLALSQWRDSAGAKPAGAGHPWQRVGRRQTPAAAGKEVCRRVREALSLAREAAVAPWQRYLAELI